MKVEDAGARTWLLAAVALWAVLTWILAALGLGGRIQALPEDPALLQALPQPGIAAEERLGPLPQYGEIGERPLFAADRRHRPFFIDPQGEEEAPTNDFDVVLTSVLIAPDFEMAIVQPREGGDAARVRVGESPDGAPGWTLTSVAPRSAVFAGPEGERTLELRAYDGVGGEPPTPVARAAAEPAPPQDGAQRASAGRRAAATIAAAQPDGQAGAQQAAATQPAGNGESDDITPSSQAEAIRRRIEARRAQLRQQQQQQQRNP